jgi:Ca-activated chloride channel family protein
MDCLSPFRNLGQARSFTAQGGIPPREQIHSGLFSSHYFDINPTFAKVEQMVDTRLFFSRFYDPVNESFERILVVGLTSLYDGLNQRHKTDVIVVIDQSGSMSGIACHAVLPGSASYLGREGGKSKMALALEAAEKIIGVLDDDEEIGVIAFDHTVSIVSELKPKGSIDTKILSETLRAISPSGGTDMERALLAAIAMFGRSERRDHNKRILFLTDATPTVGGGPNSLQAISEKAFIDSNGYLGVTYVGIGLSFDAETATELSRVHSTTIFSVSSSGELADMMANEFNYLVSPVAFDVRVGLSSSDYEIKGVYGGDDDARTDGALIECRTMTASSVGPQGVKGSVLVIVLRPKDSNNDPELTSPITLSIDARLYGSGKEEHQEHEYVLRHDPNVVTEKAFALYVYFETLRSVLAPQTILKMEFTGKELVRLSILQAFLREQRPEIASQLTEEQRMVDKLISDHSHKARPASDR